MAITIFTGLPGSGKSYKLGATVVAVLYRNKAIFDKLQREYESFPDRFIPKGKLLPEPPRRRLVHTNLKLTEEVEAEFPEFIVYWTELKQLTPLRDCDVVIDEVATYFDARLWETLSLEMRRWLSQHRKFGIEIYGTSQDFAQVDKAFRRLTSGLLYITKIAGSRDISATRPNPTWIWGISIVRELDPTKYDEQKSKFEANGIPNFMLINRKGTEIFDTRAEVMLSSALPLKHIDKECEKVGCSFKKTVHV